MDSFDGMVKIENLYKNGIVKNKEKTFEYCEFGIFVIKIS